MLSSQLCKKLGKERRGGREVEEGRENKTNSEEIEENRKNRSRGQEHEDHVISFAPHFRKSEECLTKAPNPWANWRPFCWCWQPRIWPHGSPAFMECHCKHDTSVGTRIQGEHKCTGSRVCLATYMLVSACCLMGHLMASCWSPQVLTKVVGAPQCAVKRARAQLDKCNPKSRFFGQSPSIRMLAMIFFLI